MGLRVRLWREIEEQGKVVREGSAVAEMPLGVVGQRVRVNYETTQKSVNTELTFEVGSDQQWTEEQRDGVVTEAKRLMAQAIAGAGELLTANKQAQGL